MSNLETSIKDLEDYAAMAQVPPVLFKLVGAVVREARAHAGVEAPAPVSENQLPLPEMPAPTVTRTNAELHLAYDTNCTLCKETPGMQWQRGVNGSFTLCRCVQTIRG